MGGMAPPGMVLLEGTDGRWDALGGIDDKRILKQVMGGS